MAKGSIYNTDFDNHCREIIAKKIHEFFQQKDKQDVRILVVGSPDLKEFSKIKSNIFKKASIDVFDFENQKVNQDFENQFESFSYSKGNVFDHLQKIANSNIEKKYDLIFNRWFLHHCSPRQKRKFFELSKKLMKEDALCLTIDWFVKDWETDSEFDENVKKYFEYHEKFGIAPSKQKQLMANAIQLNIENGKGGKFPSKGQIISFCKDFNLKAVYSSVCVKEVDDSELFGQFLFEIINE